MADYITKEQVIEWFRPYGHVDGGIPYYGLVTDIREMKAADVAPVRHGRWQYNTDFYVWCCSECGKNPTKGTGVVTTAEKLPAYCPNCGARMDGGDSDEAD